MIELFKNKIQRKRRELILVLLSAFAAMSILPFFIMRLLAGEFWVAIFDGTLFLVLVFNGVYVFKTGKTRAARIFFALIVVFGLIIGFYLRGVEEIPWSYPGLVLIFFAVRPNHAAILTTITIIWLGAILAPQMTLYEISVYMVTLTFTCLFVYVFANISRQQRLALTSLARKDPLTNLLNRRVFDEELNSIVGRVRKGQENCLIIFDIDYFKKINDQHGHSVGDKILIAIGQLIQRRIRKSDSLYRIGGEEFAILLPCSITSCALIVAKDVRELVENADWANGCKVTVSLGVAEYQSDESRDQWFKRCDDALYVAKNNGRNTYQLATTEQE